MPDEPGATSMTRPRGDAAGAGGPRRPGRTHRAWNALLLVPFVAVLVPGIYARESPRLWGVPFFYWYLFAWIVLSALLIAIVYRMTTPRGPTAVAHEGRGAA
jgi:Protein of unknown function (DUF3311)